MHFSTTTLASILAFTSTTLASPAITPRQSTLQPWQLTGISSISPSGRPGAYAWLSITASLTDPNALVLGTSPTNTPVTILANGLASNCKAQWLHGETPFGRSWPCDNSNANDGYWTMEILDTADFSSGMFDAKFTRVAETVYQGAGYKKVYAATLHFETGAGGNLGGQCGGSGTCSWGLKAEVKPLSVQQSEVV